MRPPRRCSRLGAAREATSQGRRRAEPPDALRGEFQRDRDRIIHTRAFRRLKHKTQVFVAPDSDHVVTRMTHTIEVQQVARSIARALGLNEDLTEAIALGARPRSHAVRARRRGSARRAATGRLSAQRAVAARRRPARGARCAA